MKSMVTGGAGFIGSHLVDTLVEQGHEVAIVDNMRSGKRENINPKAKFYEIDVLDKDKLSTAVLEFAPEAIFHLAAQNEVPYSMDHPYEDQQINIVGMMNLLEAAKDKKIKIIYSNTGGAFYGEIPDSALPITEDTPVVRPSSFYGVSKQAAELYLKLYGTIFGLPWVSLRYSNVYGPRQDGNKEAGIVAIFTAKMLQKIQPIINGKGEHTRDYIYVADVVAANIAALSYQENDYFNVSTGVETSNLQVFETIEGVMKTGMQAQFGPNRSGDVLRNVLNPTKAKSKMGWEAKVSLSDGVQKTVEYYQSLTLQH